MDRIEENGPARETLDADVVVIGAGVAGGLMAYEMRRQNRRVTILEAGPAIDRVKAVERFRASPGKGADSPYENTAYAPYPNDSTPWEYYGQKAQCGTSPKDQLAFQGLYMRGGRRHILALHRTCRAVPAQRFQDEGGLRRRP
jgi:choline dehydrogenase-like flavoprotein